jgi:hypothetical protein
MPTRMRSRRSLVNLRALRVRGVAVRPLAVDALLEDHSAVTVAARLGISRQKVYDISRPALGGPFIDRALGPQA